MVSEKRCNMQLNSSKWLYRLTVKLGKMKSLNPIF
jgi:hypothetical protein